MPLPEEHTSDTQALDSHVERQAELPPLMPGEPQVETHVETRAAKSAECAVYAVRHHNRIEVKFNNWDFGNKRCADDFEGYLKDKCGPNVVYDFSCHRRDSSSCEVIFRITWESEKRLARTMDKRIEEAIYAYSGKDQLRVQCKHPGW